MASGRARALGIATRGTTAPNRLRRVDRWLLWALRRACAARAAPTRWSSIWASALRPVTTVELARRLRDRYPPVRVLGLEIDAERVAAAAAVSGPAGRLDFRARWLRAGRHLARSVVRAMNVLRQYDEAAVARRLGGDVRDRGGR